jgi:hypothetical protein
MDLGPRGQRPVLGGQGERFLNLGRTLDHVRHGHARQVQEGLDVQVVGSLRGCARVGKTSDLGSLVFST